MERIAALPCIAQIALLYEGGVDTIGRIGERNNGRVQKSAYLYCEGCLIDYEFSILSEADIEIFLTENCKKNTGGEDIMIK